MTSSSTRPRWLVADGDRAFRAAALTTLRRAGYLADGVDTDAAATAALAGETYAGIVVDDRLQAGGSLVRRVRTLSPETRIIVTTDRYETGGAIQLLESGAHEVLEKPVTESALREVVARVLDAAPPRPREAPRNGRRDEPAGRPDGGRPRILVVDDDQLVGKAIQTVLRDFDVVFVQSAAGALGRVASGRRFAAIVCDYLMPGMNGIQFHGELVRLDPSLGRRVVFVSGWADAPELAALRMRTGCPCVPKPFDAKELLAAIGAACALEGDAHASAAGACAADPV